MNRGRVALRRDLVISLLLAVLVAVVQLFAHQPAWVVALSAGIAFLVALFVLAISDRFSTKR